MQTISPHQEDAWSDLEELFEHVKETVLDENIFELQKLQHEKGFELNEDFAELLDNFCSEEFLRESDLNTLCGENSLNFLSAVQVDQVLKNFEQEQ